MWSRIIAIIVVLITICYIIWPFDLLPDFIPLIGWFDDIFVGLVGLFALFKTIKG